LAANPRSIVSGAAGTGKSVLALDRARHLASQGRRVLYLCFNRLLAAHVRQSLEKEGVAGIDARHAHGLYSELIAAAGMSGALAAMDDSGDDFFAVSFPELATDAILETTPQPWDVLVIDEGQDLMTPAHLDVFDLLVEGGLEAGSWHVFLDPLQNLYASDVQHAAEDRLSRGYPVLERLEENCRNTRQIAAQASIVSGIDMAMAGAPDGPECDNIYYSSKADALAKLDELVTEMIDADVRPSDLIILSTRQLDNSLIAGTAMIAGRPVADLGDEEPRLEGAIAFSTMHGFKGLDRMAVIALDMGEIGDPIWSMLHYTGLSRARCQLRALVPDSAVRRYSRQATAYGERLKARI
jgi:superfamily I DNA and RNA helicase